MARNAGHIVHHDHNCNLPTVGRGRKPGLGPPATAKARSAAQVHEGNTASPLSATATRAVTKLEEASTIKEVARGRRQDVPSPVHSERRLCCFTASTFVRVSLLRSHLRHSHHLFPPSAPLIGRLLYRPPAATLSEYQDWEDVSHLSVSKATTKYSRGV